jgi:hypothetical protein
LIRIESISLFPILALCHSKLIWLATFLGPLAIGFFFTDICFALVGSPFLTFRLNHRIGTFMSVLHAAI